jgi:BirA family biotin operon repressor/biotin-[acetyl-CoA-carboxylase] ligase
VEPNVDRLKEGLRTKWVGRKIFFRHSVDSTNNWAKELAKLGADEGTVAVAETQTAGRGRLERRWFSPKGGLWFSVVLRPKLETSETVKLVFVAGLAVAYVLRELYDLKAETKWPNDVLVNGQKVCGILSEMSTTEEKVNYAVLGIGINANFDTRKVLPKELRTSATSLENELGARINLDQLFKAMLEKLECIYDLFSDNGFATVLNEWKKHADFLGKRVEVRSGAEKLCGLAEDVDEDGSLIVKLDGGVTKRVFVGDVTVRVE